MPRPFYSYTENGLALSVKVIPKASCNRYEIMTDAEGNEWMKIKITAQAEEGKANKALIKYLSKILKISTTSIAIVSGETSRNKRLHIFGDPIMLLQHLKIKP